AAGTHFLDAPPGALHPPRAQPVVPQLRHLVRHLGPRLRHVQVRRVPAGATDPAARLLPHPLVLLHANNRRGETPRRRPSGLARCGEVIPAASPPPTQSPPTLS